jgi:hypothetical protein
MRNTTSGRAAILIALVCVAGPAAAQTKTGTTLGQFLGIEPSARHAGMGNAGVAAGEGLSAAYYNPAAVGPLSDAAIQFTHSAWFADVSFEYAAAALPVAGWGTFFGSLTALNSGDIEVRTVESPLGTGEQYTVSDVAVGLGYGRQITSRFAAGIQLNYVTETIWHSSHDTFTLNLGTTYRLTEGGMLLGASLSNLGTKSGFDGRDLAIQYDADPDKYGDNSALPADQSTGGYPLPILFRVGVSAARSLGAQSRLLFLADAQHPSDNTESLSAGVEWTWKETLSLRTGYQDLFQEDSEMGFTAGVGLQNGFSDNRFHFDYAWASHKYLEEVHRLTFVVVF